MDELFKQMWCNSGYSFNLLVIQTLPYGQTAQTDLGRLHWINEYPTSVNLLSSYAVLSGEKKSAFQHTVYLQWHTKWTDGNQHRLKAACLTSSLWWFWQLSMGLSSIAVANAQHFQCGTTLACTYQNARGFLYHVALSDVPASIWLSAVMGYLALLSTSAFSIFCPVRNCHIPPL